jgi:predicted transcriptional regulator
MVQSEGPEFKSQYLKEKKSAKNGSEYLQIICQIRDFYPEYINNSSQNPKQRQKNFEKQSKGFKYAFLQGR